MLIYPWVSLYMACWMYVAFGRGVFSYTVTQCTQTVTQCTQTVHTYSHTVHTYRHTLQIYSHTVQHTVTQCRQCTHTVTQCTQTVSPTCFRCAMIGSGVMDMANLGCATYVGLARTIH
jgi:hypothetical protein